MDKDLTAQVPWNIYSSLIILCFILLQAARWIILPQFMDIYYHLLTAVGFIQAGGYSGWDFWEYAPMGRIHIYPPVFHIILAFLIKSGLNKIIIARLFESAMPVVFLCVLWGFARGNFSDGLGFFCVLAAASSLSFFLSLMNHIPATLAMIFGLLAITQFFKAKLIRSSVLLALCFYTHIGISWFFLSAILIYGFLERRYLRGSLITAASALLLSFPMIFKEIAGFIVLKKIGIGMMEVQQTQIKFVDYLLLLLGVIYIFKRRSARHRIFIALFLASLIFLVYPYRFFSAEGYLPVILLVGSALFSIYDKFSKKYVIILCAIFCLFFSPTFSLHREFGQRRTSFRLKFFDSSVMGIALPRDNSMWLGGAYKDSIPLIMRNSAIGDSIYSTMNFVGICLAGLSGRSTANGLLPEIASSRRFDPFRTSKIIVFTKLDEPQLIHRIASFYNLGKLGENKYFIFYANPHAVKVHIPKAGIGFPVIVLAAICGLYLYWKGDGLLKMPAVDKYIDLHN